MSAWDHLRHRSGYRPLSEHLDRFCVELDFDGRFCEAVMDLQQEMAVRYRQRDSSGYVVDLWAGPLGVEVDEFPPEARDASFELLLAVLRLQELGLDEHASAVADFVHTTDDLEAHERMLAGVTKLLVVLERQAIERGRDREAIAAQVDEQLQRRDDELWAQIALLVLVAVGPALVGHERDLGPPPPARHHPTVSIHGPPRRIGGGCRRPLTFGRSIIATT